MKVTEIFCRSHIQSNPTLLQSTSSWFYGLVIQNFGLPSYLTILLYLREEIFIIFIFSWNSGNFL